MKQTSPLATFSVLLLAAIAAFAPVRIDAHCQVPCGIYDDPARFAEMKEHTATVTKAMAQIAELATAKDAQSAQQLARWVANKESHADAIQKICQQYFLAQRVKIPAADAPASARTAYLSHLELVHHIIVHAMKCKQNADPAHAVALLTAIESYEKAYGK